MSFKHRLFVLWIKLYWLFEMSLSSFNWTRGAAETLYCYYKYNLGYNERLDRLYRLRSHIERQELAGMYAKCYETKRR